MDNEFTVKRDINSNFYFVIFPIALVNILNLFIDNVGLIGRIIIISIAVAMIFVLGYSVFWLYRHRFDVFRVELMAGGIHFHPGQHHEAGMIKEIKVTKRIIQFRYKNTRSAKTFVIEVKQRAEIIKMLDSYCAVQRISFISKP